jgi:hypothetical protein
MPSAQRCMASFVLAEICNGYRDGQLSCLQQGLHRTCTGILKSSLEGAQVGKPPSDTSSYSNGTCKQWIALCLFKLCEDFAYAKYLIFSESDHVQLYPLLLDQDVTG